MKRIILPALLGAVFAMPVVAQSPSMIKSVDVETELTAIQNPEAAAFYANLDSDLEGAITAQLTDRIGEDGMEVKIDISEIELANAFDAAVGADQSVLNGTVKVIDLTNNTNFKAFDLSVTMNETLPLLPAGTDVTVVSPTSTEFYTALVAAYAKAVVDRIDN